MRTQRLKIKMIEMLCEGYRMEEALKMARRHCFKMRKYFGEQNKQTQLSI